MFRRLVKYSFLALLRQKAYVLINIFGLSVGIACSMIIALFIIHELIYDQYNEKKDLIYRVILNGKIGGQEVTVTSTASPIGPAMHSEFPEVEDFLRINSWSETNIKYNDNYFTEDEFIEADSSFFNFFSIPLIKGNKNTVLSQPHTMVISETACKKIFGDVDPINKMLKVGNDTVQYQVTGVMQDIPETTHFKADAIGSFTTNPRSKDNQWLSNSFDTYVLLYPNSDPEKVNPRFKDMIIKYVGPEISRYLGLSMEDFLSQGNKYNMFLQSLTDIHLDPSIQNQLEPASDPKYLYIFGSIAVFIIVIASINFMNLSTAQASRRAKEVGIKKVCGSTRGILISQFLLEAIILSFLALVVAILIAEVSLPYFNRLLGLQLHVGYFNSWYTIPIMLVFSITVGIISGSYPAFFLSSFNPYMVLKGKIVSSRGSINLRSILVVLQFSISIILIVGTLIMSRQIRFMLNKNLGFNKENVLVLNQAETIGKHIETFKDALVKIPGVINVSASTAVPGHNNNLNGYTLKGRTNETFLLQTNWVDYDYLKTYGIQLSSGRFFDESFATDKDACIINEMAVKSFDMKDPFSEKFGTNDNENEGTNYRQVIGVVKDFHFESLRTVISPYLFRFKDDNNNWGYISIRIAPTASAITIEAIEKVWGSFTSNEPMQYFFMDQDVERLYKEERQSLQLSFLFTILGILIASLGLYGLTAFTVQQRTKEIGIRKTFGASVSSIWYIIAREIFILVIISTAIAGPVIYWVAGNWLQNYHYRTNLKLTDFIMGFVIAIIIALATISYRTIKTANVNPSTSLRYE